MTHITPFVMVVVVALTAATQQSPRPPQAPSERPEKPRPWPSPMDFPDGMESYKPTTLTQSIFVLNDADVIKRVPIAKLPDTRWHQSGGMYDVKGYKSRKFRLLPERVRHYVGTIQVKNSDGYYQPNRGVKREYPDGTRFDDVLTNDKDECFEHRSRQKNDGKWSSKVLYENKSARPDGYTGLSITCASCHDEAGSGGYAVGLVPGGDTVISDPLDWSVAAGRLR